MIAKDILGLPAPVARSGYSALSQRSNVALSSDNAFYPSANNTLLDKRCEVVATARRDVGAAERTPTTQGCSEPRSIATSILSSENSIEK